MVHLPKKVQEKRLEVCEPGLSYATTVLESKPVNILPGFLQ